VQSLADVSIAGRAGSIHAVTGENGAGKSTLMKIIAGVIRPSAGQVTLRGKAVDFSSPLDALKAGISTVFQEFSLVSNLTVAETMFLAHEPRKGLFLDRPEMERRAALALAEVGLDVHPRRAVSSLTVAEQQSVEIAKGLMAEADIFIFDEPTAALNTNEVARLERILLSLRDQGKCIFYISHRMPEIFELCDTATVLKDGRLVGTYPTAELDADRLLSLMVGREVEALYPPRADVTGENLMTVTGMHLGKNRKVKNFALGRGEIVALAGLEGQGQREIIRTLAGLEPDGSATVRIDGAGSSCVFRPSGGSARSLRHGIAFMPEDRKSEGLYLGLSVQDNLTLGVHQKQPMYGIARGFPSLVKKLAERLRIRTASVRTTVLSLSGGNQQKVMLGRWLAVEASVLLIEEPTRGVDVGAKAEIYNVLREFCAKGGAVLFCSRELPEVIGLADRVLVVSDGQIVADRPAEGLSEESILQAAMNRSPDSQPVITEPV